MQMRAGDATGSAAEAEAVALGHALALVHVDAAEVHRYRKQPKAVVDDDAIAFEIERAGQHDHAAVAGADRCTHGRAEVHAFMDAGEFAVEHAPGAEAVGRWGGD